MWAWASGGEGHARESAGVRGAGSWASAGLECGPSWGVGTGLRVRAGWAARERARGGKGAGPGGERVGRPTGFGLGLDFLLPISILFSISKTNKHVWIQIQI